MARYCGPSCSPYIEEEAGISQNSKLHSVTLSLITRVEEHSH